VLPRSPRDFTSDERDLSDLQDLDMWPRGEEDSEVEVEILRRQKVKVEALSEDETEVKNVPKEEYDQGNYKASNDFFRSYCLFFLSLDTSALLVRLVFK